MAEMTITVGYLYPDVMSTYGDRGNVETVVRRCQWRNIEAVVTELRLGDHVEPGTFDLLVIGGGGESQQRLVARDLYQVKGAGIRESVAGGTAALAVGGGFELFGRFCQPQQGAEFHGIELFDAWTIRSRIGPGESDRTISQEQANRVIGELVVRRGGKLLVGFENHGGGTYLGPTAEPLGQVLTGHGNNGDGTEGVILGSAIGTHLRGPCLPRNPALADFLIGAALRRRHGELPLPPLADELEKAARDTAIRRAREGAQPSHGRLRRAGPGRAAARGARLTPVTRRVKADPARRSVSRSRSGSVSRSRAGR
jgi:lipid II isoglutaminyl synthase (glutamine-hydrolysing)